MSYQIYNFYTQKIKDLHISKENIEEIKELSNEKKNKI